MNRKQMGLTGKLMGAIIGLSFLLGAIACVIGYMEFTAVLERQYNDNVYEIARIAQSYLNPDKFESYLTAGQTDEEYREVQERLDKLADTAKCDFVYVARVDPRDYKTLTYIYSSGSAAAGGERGLGSTETGIDKEYVNDMLYVLAKGGNAAQDLYSCSEESGVYTAVGLAVMDSDGRVAAILGVEKKMKRLIDAREEYMSRVVYCIVVAVVMFLVAYSAFLHQEMITPLLAVTKEAERFADSNIPSDVLSSISKTDEIGVLAKAVSKMEKDIQSYVENLVAVTAEKERIGAELNVATQIQASMLPCIFPPFPDRREFDIYASMDPAKEVGGDFYDFFMVDERHLAIVIADVSGKGVPAALFMVIGKTLIKDHTQPNADLGEIFTQVNSLLCEANSEGLFITAFEGVLDLVTGELLVVNAGHEPPYICRKGGIYEQYKVRAGFVLAGMEGMRYQAGSILLDPGDKVFLYTDGVTEAVNGENTLYSLERLKAVLEKNAGKTPGELLPAVKADIEAFSGTAPQFDDITMLCLEYRERMVDKK